MKNAYSLTETIGNIYSLLVTKIFYKHARLIRRPFFCRGKRSLYFEKGFTTGRGCRFDLPSKVNQKEKTLIFGENCRIGDYVHIVALSKVEIGNNVLMASKIFISDTNHGNYEETLNVSRPETPPNDRELTFKKVKIGNNVWIGENVVILPGIVIGDGCVIGANCVLTKSVPKNSMVAGIPGKVIKKYDELNNKWERVMER